MFSSLLAESSWRIALDRNTIVVMLVLNAELHNNRALVEGKPHLLLQGFTATPCSLSHLHCWPSALAKLLKPKDPSSARRRPGNLLFRAFAFSMTRALSTGTSADQIHPDNQWSLSSNCQVFRNDGDKAECQQLITRASSISVPECHVDNLGSLRVSQLPPVSCRK